MAFEFKAWNRGVNPLRSIGFAFLALEILNNNCSLLIPGNRFGNSGIIVIMKSSAVERCNTDLITDWFSW